MNTHTQNAAPGRTQPPLTIDQFAAELGVCRRTVYELIAKRALRSFKIGRLRRIPRSELEDFPRRQLEAAEA